MKVYVASFGRLSALFPKSRWFDDLASAKEATDKLLSSRRWYGGANAVIVIMASYGPATPDTSIVSIKQDGVWHDLDVA